MIFGRNLQANFKIYMKMPMALKIKPEIALSYLMTSQVDIAIREFVLLVQV